MCVLFLCKIISSFSNLLFFIVIVWLKFELLNRLSVLMFNLLNFPLVEFDIIQLLNCLWVHENILKHQFALLTLLISSLSILCNRLLLYFFMRSIWLNTILILNFLINITISMITASFRRSLFSWWLCYILLLLLWLLFIFIHVLCYEILRFVEYDSWVVVLIANLLQCI